MRMYEKRDNTNKCRSYSKLKWYIHYDYGSFSSLMLCVCSGMFLFGWNEEEVKIMA